MLDIVWRDGPLPDLVGTQALLFTSANGVRALARLSDRRDLPAFAVGSATAAAAAAAGFGPVARADGDIAALAALVAARCDPAAGRLCHVAGSVVAGDLAGRLGADGFAVERAVLYDARPATSLSDTTVAALREGALDGVLFYSPRSAASFVRLLGDAGLLRAVAAVTALCLSPAVAQAVLPAPWRAALTAARPDQEALFALLDSI
ncbi:MAG: uroporphyrinogen-III synthase [Azospirillum sp.]|nr:uroporphyrinogen-III synthase [Azospirillum sp.]